MEKVLQVRFTQVVSDEPVESMTVGNVYEVVYDHGDSVNVYDDVCVLNTLYKGEYEYVEG